MKGRHGYLRYAVLGAFIGGVAPLGFQSGGPVSMVVGAIVGALFGLALWDARL